MGYYIDKKGNYYEGDKAAICDMEVQQRQNPTDVWVNGAWAEDTGNLQAEKDEILTQARDIRDRIITRLMDILFIYNKQNNFTHDESLLRARQSLLDMTKDPRIIAATDGASTKIAVITVYREVADALEASDPSSVSAFNGMSL